MKANQLYYYCWVMLAQQQNDKRWVAFNINTQQITSPQKSMLDAIKAINSRFNASLWKDLPPLNKHNKLYTCKGRYVNGQWFRFELPMNWRMVK